MCCSVSPQDTVTPKTMRKPVLGDSKMELIEYLKSLALASQGNAKEFHKFLWVKIFWVRWLRYCPFANDQVHSTCDTTDFDRFGPPATNDLTQSQKVARWWFHLNNQVNLEPMEQRTKIMFKNKAIFLINKLVFLRPITFQSV